MTTKDRLLAGEIVMVPDDHGYLVPVRGIAPIRPPVKGAAGVLLGEKTLKFIRKTPFASNPHVMAVTEVCRMPRDFWPAK